VSLRLTCMLVAGVALSACSAPADEPIEAPETAATEAAPEAGQEGYEMRLDSERSDPGQFIIEELENSLQIQTGPAGIAYHPSDRIDSGDFHVEATYTQYGAPVGYREAYGLFVGGLDLQTTENEYTYLLVRPTGEYLIKRRISDTTETLVDWTPHDAISTVDAEGDEPVNTLSIDVFGAETRFLINGVQVHAVPSSSARPYGIAGLRVNHRLDVRITDWRLFNTLDES